MTHTAMAHEWRQWYADPLVSDEQRECSHGVTHLDVRDGQPVTVCDWCGAVLP
jgi:hypothetical protein